MTGPMQLTLVIGAATPPGRLAAAVRFAAEEAARLRPVARVSAIDLASTRLETCDGRSEERYDETTRAAIAEVRAARAVILGSPVYRATFPGVLKNLLDLLPVEALHSKPVGILAMGATHHHYLAVDSHLRMVLAWFGALVLPTSVYVTGKDFAEGKLASEEARREIGELVESALALAERLGGASLGPPPLASKS